MADLLIFLVLALALGFKHSYDADHLVAVSTVLTRTTDLRRAGRLSVAWALGHMLTAGVITVLLFFFREAAEGWLSNFELLVAIMLIVIGVVALVIEHPAVGRLWRDRFHRHEHEHGPTRHDHEHPHFFGVDREHGLMLGIGIVHGLASNDELIVLFVASLGIATLPGVLTGVFLFSIGVVIGMILFAWAVTFPGRRWGTERVQRAVRVTAAVISLVYGVLILLGLGL